MRLRTLEYKKIVAIAFVFGVFMDILDTTIVNVAVPSLQRTFGVGASRIEWVITGSATGVRRSQRRGHEFDP